MPRLAPAPAGRPGGLRGRLAAALGLSAALGLLSCTPPRPPVGLRAAISQVADLRPSDGAALSAPLSQVFLASLTNRLLRRDRFGSEAVAQREIVLTTELLAATVKPQRSAEKQRGFPVSGETRLTYVRPAGDGYLLEARVRVHVRRFHGGQTLKSYVVERKRFQPHSPNADDIAILAELLADGVHDVVARDFELFYSSIKGAPAKKS